MEGTRMKLLIIGAAGMLGHKLFQRLKERFPETCATALEDIRKPPFDKVPFLQGDDVISNVNVTDFDRLEAILKDIKPDYIVNCVGIIKQRDTATAAIPSITINSLLPHKLARFASAWGGRVIHFSTDCVFDGRKGNYTEQDPSTAEDLYGKSKYLGEVAAENALTLRTSIIGRELVTHQSLLDWFLRQEGQTVRGFTRVIYSGITTNQMANVVTRIVEQHPTLSGLYQVVSKPISKHDLLCGLRDAYNLNVDIQPDDGPEGDRSMLGNKLREATGYISPPWPDLIDDLVTDSTPYKEWVNYP